LAADARHQNQRSDRVGGKTLNSSISNLAARLAAKEEEEARHSLPIEKAPTRYMSSFTVFMFQELQ